MAKNGQKPTKFGQIRENLVILLFSKRIFHENLVSFAVFKRIFRENLVTFAAFTRIFHENLVSFAALHAFFAIITLPPSAPPSSNARWIKWMAGG